MTPVRVSQARRLTDYRTGKHVRCVRTATPAERSSVFSTLQPSRRDMNTRVVWWWLRTWVQFHAIRRLLTPVMNLRKVAERCLHLYPDSQYSQFSASFRSCLSGQWRMSNLDSNDRHLQLLCSFHFSSCPIALAKSGTLQRSTSAGSTGAVDCVSAAAGTLLTRMGAVL